MERYFTLLNDCVAENVELKYWMWTSAVVFAGKWVRNTTTAQVKGAIETWMRMEDHGHQANVMTFSVLFQIAVRAGRFALADAIFNELKARDLELDRFFRINVIYYAGERQDGDGVRQAFRDLVNAGEIVDTSVMNCVITALLRAGEFAPAEHVFYRMKSLHEQKFGIEAPREWQNKKQLAKLLNRTGQDLRREKEAHEASFFGAAFSSIDKREKIQNASPIAPDERTYQILIKHHVYTSGELDKVKTYLAEMRAQEMRIHGSVYVHILRGFQAHGGFQSSLWDRNSLEEIWKEILAEMKPFESAIEASEPAQVEEVPRAEPEESRSPGISNESDNYDMLGAMMSDQHNSNPVPEPHLHAEIPDQPEQLGTENQTYTPLTGAPPPDNEQAQTEPIDEVVSEIAEFEPQAHISKGLAVSAAYAFHNCFGKRRMLEVWKELRVKWTYGSHDDKMHVQGVVNRLNRS